MKMILNIIMTVITRIKNSTTDAATNAQTEVLEHNVVTYTVLDGFTDTDIVVLEIATVDFALVVGTSLEIDIVLKADTLSETLEAQTPAKNLQIFAYQVFIMCLQVMLTGVAVSVSSLSRPTKILLLPLKIITELTNFYCD